MSGSPPEFVFADSGPAYIDGDLALLAWQLGPAGAEPAARGIDILTLRDGVIAELRTILA